MYHLSFDHWLSWSSHGMVYNMTKVNSHNKLWGQPGIEACESSVS